MYNVVYYNLAHSTDYYTFLFPKTLPLLKHPFHSTFYNVMFTCSVMLYTVRLNRYSKFECKIANLLTDRRGSVAKAF